MPHFDAAFWPIFSISNYNHMVCRSTQIGHLFGNFLVPGIAPMDGRNFKSLVIRALFGGYSSEL